MGVGDLMFPTFCLHCDTRLASGQKHFCPPCQADLALLNPKERCPFCFSEPPCHCSKRETLKSVAAAFDYRSPMGSLIRSFKYAKLPHLASVPASFLAVQFERLSWPDIDCVVPVPSSPLRFLLRGYHPSDLLAHFFAAYFDFPMIKALKRKWGGHSQAALSKKERHELSASQFVWQKKFDLKGKRVLLIDDVMATRATLQACAKALLQARPKEIYALTVVCSG